MNTRTVTILTALLTSSALAEQWPQYHGNHSNRTTPEKVANTDWKSTAPKKLWKASTPTGFSSFIVADGNAYTVIQEEIDGIPSEVCIAFDAEEGTTQWKANLDMWRLSNGGGNAGAPDNKGGDGPRSTPAYAEGHVYCYTSDIRLVCLSAKDGSEKWAVEVAKQHGGKNIRWENASSPLIEGNLVIVQGGGPGQSFLAFDKASGSLKWKSGSYNMTHATPVATTINNKRQVLFFCQEGMVSVDPKDGSRLWFHKFPFKVSTAASAVVEGNIVYFAAGYGVGSTAVKVSKDNSTTELWFSEGNKPITNHWSTPLVKDGHLYGMFGFKEYASGPLKCIELATGKVKWEKEGYGPGGVCLAAGTLICLGDAGQLTLVKATPESYQELSRIDNAINGKCWSAPVLSDGKIYIRSTLEGVCLDVR
ncbi:MAG: PQQ-like beta-propeller repeat protein [Verrucomicrobiales bacterium]|nr:PQQ-like beta-propeller repeat protein [Verrucomicrobiales bacterium]MED5585746.1 PQQ-binding-like beta-propeller repeat protein [Verrucomicrobiota bacterium]